MVEGTASDPSSSVILVKDVYWSAKRTRKFGMTSKREMSRYIYMGHCRLFTQQNLGSCLLFVNVNDDVTILGRVSCSSCFDGADDASGLSSSKKWWLVSSSLRRRKKCSDKSVYRRNKRKNGA